MSLGALFVTAFVIGLTGAVMPGPLFTMTVAECLRAGWRPALWLMCGHAILEGALVLALAAGLSTVVDHPLVLRSMAVLGGGVLAWMAYGALRTALHPPADLVPVGGATNPAPPTSRARLMWLGAAVSASNPYWVVWWATIGITYVLASIEHGAPGVPVFYGGHILSDFTWYLFVGGLIATGRRWLRPTAVRAVFAVCALVLAGFGGYFLLSGLGIAGSLGLMASAT